MLDLLAATEIPGLPVDPATLGVTSLALIVGGFIVYRWFLIPERQRADRYEEEIRELNKATTDRLLPAVLSSTALLSETQKLMAEFQYRGRNGHS